MSKHSFIEKPLWIASEGLLPLPAHPVPEKPGCAAERNFFSTCSSKTESLTFAFLRSDKESIVNCLQAEA